jgi:hypothetical protein
MKPDIPALRRLVVLILGLGWASTVFAAQAIMTTQRLDLIGLPWAQIGLGCALSLWGGLTRSSQRALEPRAEGAGEFRLGAELRKDFLVSSSCGLVTFLLGAWQDWNIWFLGLSLWVAGYLGARFLTDVSDAVMDRIKGLIQAVPTDKTPPSGGT